MQMVSGNRTMKLLDLFCGDGGCTRGYELAGFEVVGVDIEFKKRYCGAEFIKADAIQYLKEIIQTGEVLEYDLIHASPPCQAYSSMKHLHDKTYPDLVGITRDLLIQSSRPYVIENVVGAPLINPIMLCGMMFDLKTYRHRLFECSFSVDQPIHPKHVAKCNKMGRPLKKDEFITVVGHFSGIEIAREVMEISWMTSEGLSQAIPPKYTEYIGNQFVNQ